MDYGKVVIVMSVFKPNYDFFIKQLDSLNNQTYSNIELLIWNDCPEEKLDADVIKEHITNFNVTMYAGKKNIGYVKAFEKLTELAEGEYIAYCDHDDIWLENKIEILTKQMYEQNAVLATSDRMVIDENDNVVIKSVRHDTKEREAKWNSFDDITKFALFSCYAIGMATMVKADVAKACIPFPYETAHDKWLCACASQMGKVLFIDEVLVKYRRHSSNESGVLSKITDKEQYYNERSECAYRLTKLFLEKFPDFDIEDRKDVLNFAKARRKRKATQIFKYRYLAPTIAKYEILLKFTPNFLFKRLIKHF